MVAATPPSTPLRRSLTLVTAAGCLAVIFETAVTSPATTAFLRSMGFTPFHFGLIGGLPMVLLAMQFVGALLANRLPRRKPAFMVLSIASRLLFLLVAFLPILAPGAGGLALIWVVIAIMVLRSALANMVAPMWFAWMGDLIPRRLLSTYWGSRQVWMHIAWLGAYGCVLAVTHWVERPIGVVLPILAAIGCAAGVADILLFLRVDEPPNAAPPREPVLRTLTEPLRHRDYRFFVLFNCVWSAAVMSSAAFMMIYVLEGLKIGVGRTTLMWVSVGFGGILTARAWGQIVDTHGSRPVILFCVALKWPVVLVFMLLTPANVVYALPVTFLFDSMLNAGIAIATNGYMLRIAPRENRAMFIAAISGLSGIFGGLGAMAGGAFLKAFSDLSFQGFGRTWTSYHVLFAAGTVLRMGCILLARRIREPQSARASEVVHYIRGSWPVRVLLFPVGLYRRMTDTAEGT